MKFLSYTITTFILMKAILRERRNFQHVMQITLLMGYAAISCCAQDADMESAFQKGAAAMKEGRGADAERYFREATRLAPQMSEAHLDLGLALGRNGKLEEAIRSISTALALNPRLSGAHMFLGIFLYQANRQNEARVALEAEIAQNPSNAEALMWLGIVKLAMGHPEQAVAPLDRAFELMPDDLNLLESRGRAHSLVAHDSYSRMAQIDPDSWHVHRVQAEIYAEDGKHSEAITEYQAAIKLQPQNPDLYEALGDEYRATNQLDAAQNAYAKELELNPRNPIAMYDLGSLDIEKGNDEDGVKLLVAMLKSFTNAPVAEYYLGRGLAAQGQNEEALKWLKKSVENEPSDEVAKRAYYELARLYRKMQMPVEAERALQSYNRLRETENKKNAHQIEDWRNLEAKKTNTPVAEEKNGR